MNREIELHAGDTLGRYWPLVERVGLVTEPA